MQSIFLVDSLLLVLTVAATAVMAISGVIQAARTHFDAFGAGVLAMISAVGGGTVRDLLLGATPVFWVTDLVYIATILPVVVIGVFAVKAMSEGQGARMRWLNYFDAVGLGLFTLLGAHKALAFEVHPIIAVLLGCVTGVMGGMLRDVLCGEQPIVLKEGLYATWSLLGAAAFVLLLPFMSLHLSGLLAFAVIVIGRVVAIRRGSSLRPLG